MKNRFEIKGATCEVILQKSPSGEPFRMLIDTADLPLISSVSGTWYAQKSPHYTTHYARINVRLGPCQHTAIQAHVLIMKPDAGLKVDHKNRFGLDNRRDNLRSVTQAVNSLNRRSPAGSTHGTRGVTYVNRGASHWRARVVIGGKSHGLGNHLTPESAQHAVAEFLIARGVPEATARA